MGPFNMDVIMTLTRAIPVIERHNLKPNWNGFWKNVMRKKKNEVGNPMARHRGQPVQKPWGERAPWHVQGITLRINN